MALYSTAVRTSRMDAIRAAVVGGSLVFCKGTVPSSLAAPSAGDILTQHALSGTVGSVANGVWTISSSDIAADSSANNDATDADDPTYAVFLSSGGTAVAMFPGTEVTMTATPASGDTKIMAGRQVNVTGVTITEGGV